MSIYDEAGNRGVTAIMKELAKQENFDLILAMLQIGESDTDGNQSFMFGFAQPFRHEMTFEEFERVTYFLEGSELYAELGIERSLVPMHIQYQQYLNELKEARELSPLNESQAERWNAIIRKVDEGWSGALYGLICRRVQWLFQNPRLN